MLSSTYRTINAYQPVGYTGIIRHVGMWIFSNFNDITIPNPNAKNINENSIAIYCIHGTADRNSSFSLIADRLKNNLPSHIQSIHLVSFDSRAQGKGIDYFAEQLKNKILSNKHKNIILIGHSRGGLVNAYFTEYLANHCNINVLFTVSICTPYNGSGFAFGPIAWYSSSVTQMKKESDFLKELSEKIKASTTPYYYFAAKNDWVVTPDECCVKTNKGSLIILDRHGHLSILSSRRLVTIIKNYLLCTEPTVTNLLTSKL